MAAAQDFNYKVALASGLRELQAGRLRQAEQQFEYLCAKFPASAGGYPGLAQGRVGQAPRPAAPARPPARAPPGGPPAGAIRARPRRARPEAPEAPNAVDPRLGLLGVPAAPADDEAASDAVPEPEQPRWTVPQRERVPEPVLDANEDPLHADAIAAEYIASGDPRAAQAALVAARHFIADGRPHAASDLLLQLLASGIADHQAQPLLVEGVSPIGKP